MMKWFGITAIIWIFDRVTKLYVLANLELGERIVVLPFFSWIHLHNTGAAFSFLSDAGGWQRWFFVLLALVFSAYLIFELRRLELKRLAHKLGGVQQLQAWSFTLILSGALGNLYDRAMDGYVVDFVLVHYQNHYFPAFNVADSAITLGACGWIFSMFLEARAARVRACE